MSVRDSSEPSARVPDDQFLRRRTLASLTLGVVLGPVVALVNQELMYLVDLWVCGHGAKGSLHLVPALCLLVVLAAGIVAYLNWRAVGRGVEDEHGRALTRTRFLALVGIAISAFSALVILAQWFAAFMFSPCMRA